MSDWAAILAALVTMLIGAVAAILLGRHAIRHRMRGTQRRRRGA